MEAARMSRDRRPFFALMAANAISQVGHMMTSVAVPWLVLETTGSAARVGFTGAALAIGSVVPAILGGPVVDRLGLRRSSIAADLVSGVTVAAIPVLHLLGVLQYWQLLIIAFLLSGFTTQGDTGRLGLIPGLANRASMALERANATDRGIARVGMLVGPLLAGVLIPFIGAADVLFIDVAGYAISASLVGFVVPAAATAMVRPDLPKTSRNYRADLSEGLRFVFGNRLVLSMMLLCLVGNFFDLPLITVVLPVYAKEIFGTASSLGLMLGSLAAGTLVGTVVFGASGRRLPRRQVFLWGWLLAPLIAYGALSARIPLPGLVVAGLIAGFAAGPINPILATVVQENTPPQLLGRVFGAFLAFAQAGIPFGAAIAGVVIEGTGLIRTIEVGGAVYVIVVAAMFFNPALRRMDAKVATVKEPVAGDLDQAHRTPQARRSATMKAGL
jgi:MFS family permease